MFIYFKAKHGLECGNTHVTAGRRAHACGDGPPSHTQPPNSKPTPNGLLLHTSRPFCRCSCVLPWE